ncbi:MAG: Unknown protein, partial [uncultured Thiotrichaceae bacterium]
MNYLQDYRDKQMKNDNSYLQE